VSFRDSDEGELRPFSIYDMRLASQMLRALPHEVFYQHEVERDTEVFEQRGEVADLKPIKEILHRAFRHTYKDEAGKLPLSIERSHLGAAEMRDGKDVVQVDPEGVGRVARDLESLVAMSDGIADTQMVTVQTSLADLRSFVCYMRELDLSYRSVLSLAAEQVEKAKRKREKPNLILPKGVGEE
jgi:hypothetical protein